MDGLAWLPWAFIAALFFFGLGWISARIDAKRLQAERSAPPHAYFRGLDFLLNEQPDKALDALLEASRQHPEAVELQFALGSLFRRRGEIDRALRVHRELSERSGISRDQRIAALYELALDYHRSGLLDHAEKILMETIGARDASATQRRDALNLLLNLYEQERAWKKAIDTARTLDADLPREKRAHDTRIANFHCELATEAHAANDAAEARRRIELALDEHPGAVRANLLRAEWLAAEGRHAEAIATWHRIEHQDPAFLGLAADAMLKAYEAQGEGGKGLADLRELQRHYPTLDLLDALFRATLTAEGPAAAARLIQDELRANPTLVGLDRLLEAQLLAADPADERRTDLQLLKEIVHSHAIRLAVYLCKSCGFRARQYYWHCPACNEWNTFSPRRTAEFDTAQRHLARFHAEAGGGISPNGD